MRVQQTAVPLVNDQADKNQFQFLAVQGSDANAERVVTNCCTARKQLSIRSIRSEYRPETGRLPHSRHVYKHLARLSVWKGLFKDDLQRSFVIWETEKDDLRSTVVGGSKRFVPQQLREKSLSKLDKQLALQSVSNCFSVSA